MTTASSSSSGVNPGLDHWVDHSQMDRPSEVQAEKPVKGLKNKVLPTAVAGYVPAPEPTPLARVSSKFKRWLGGEEDQSLDAALPTDVQLAQASVTAVSAPSQGAPGPVVSEEALPPAVTHAQPAPASTGSRMPDFMNDSVGGVPLGAVVTSGALLLYGLAGKGNSSGVSSDTRAPVLQTAVTSADGKTIVLTYDETLAASTTMPAAGAFSVTSEGVPVTVSKVTRGADGKSVELTLDTAITGLKTALVSYTAPAAPAAGSLDLTLATRDVSGNHAVSFSAQPVTVIDTTAPTVVSGNAYTTADATVLVLKWSETLLDTLPALSAFTVTLDGAVVPINAISVVGAELRLTLQNKLTNAVGHANVFTVAYTAPVADVVKTNAALQDVTGNDAASIVTPFVISNHVFDTTAPVVSTATINAVGREITLTWTEALDGVSTAPVSAYSVQLAEGGGFRSVAVSSVRVSGSSVVLVLAEDLVSAGAGIQVGYTAPASGNAVLQDLAGNDVVSFSARSVVNNIDAVLPAVVASSFKDSKTLVLTYSEDLLTTAVAPATAFSVVSASKDNPVTAVKVSGKTVELSLTNAVASGEASSWGYAAPTADRSVTNAVIQDLVGNDMASATAQAVDTTRASLKSANTGTSGNLLVLTFDEPMLSTNLPAGTAFQVLGGQSGLHTVSSLSVSGSVVSLNLATPMLWGETVRLTYTAPADNIGIGNAALQDLAGNDLSHLGTPAPLSVDNNVAAQLLTKSLALGTNSQLNQLVLNFDVSLSGTPAVTAFTVLANGVTQNVSAVHVSDKTVTLDLATPLSGSTVGPVTVSYTAPTTGALLQDSLGHAVVSFSSASVASVRWGTADADIFTGTTAADFFVLSQGNDVLTGLGGIDVFAWPQNTATSPSTTTIKDFGLKAGSGTLQGSVEADILDLSHLLVGYTSATRSQFLQVTQDSAGKLLLKIDHDGGASFSATESVVFDNITVNSSSNLVVNGTTTSYTLSNVLDQLVADAQLRLV